MTPTESAVRPGRRQRAVCARERAQERAVLLEGLDRTKILLQQAYAAFNSVCDPDLIDSCVYEINALQARYCYLLRRVKQLDAPVQAV